MITILVTYFLLVQLTGVLFAMALGRAAAHADGEFAAEALAQGRPDIAASYLQGCGA